MAGRDDMPLGTTTDTKIFRDTETGELTASLIEKDAVYVTPEEEVSTAAYIANQIKKVLSAIVSIPLSILNALRATTSWVWKNGIEEPTAYPNKAAAKNLTFGKVIKQLVGFAVSTVLTTAVRLAHLAGMVLALSPYFFLLFAVISTAPISVPAAAAIAGLTTLFTPFVVSTVVGIAAKSFWEGPAKAFSNMYFKLINEKLGNKEKYSSGNEFDYVAKLFHQMGYQGADMIGNAIGYVLNLPVRAVNRILGKPVQVEFDLAKGETAKIEVETGTGVNVEQEVINTDASNIHETVTAPAGSSISYEVERPTPLVSFAKPRLVRSESESTVAHGAAVAHRNQENAVVEAAVATYREVKASRPSARMA